MTSGFKGRAAPEPAAAVSRRSAAVLLLVLLVAAVAPARSLAQGNPIQNENAKPGSTGWELPGMSPNGEPTASTHIQGYTSQISMQPGDALQLHVSTSPAAPYRIEIYRLGWYGGDGGRLIACIPASCTSSESGVVQPVPSPDPNTGELDAGWPITDSITVGSDWTTGYYVAKLILTGGADGGQADWVPFIVRAPAGTPSAILVQASVNTWEAYDNWGGKSLYTFNSTSSSVPASRSNEAAMVSFNRPFAGDSNAGPFMWEYNLVRYLERNGYDVSYQTDVDSDSDPASLLDHNLDIANGHDEYWTPAMRDNWDAARAADVNLAFMGGNIMSWQARYQDDYRTLVEYRKGNLDPEPVNSLKTDLFTSSYVNRPECQLLGVGHGGKTNPADPPRSYYVPSSALTNPWFNGTGLAAGDTLTDTVGYEWDRVVPCSVPTPTEVLEFDGLTTGNPGSYGTGADAVTYTASSGARVFSASSMQVNWALDDFGHPPHVNPHAQILFANIFNDLGAIPVPVLAASSPGATPGSPVRFSWTTSMGMSSYQVSVDGNVVATLGAAFCSPVTCAVDVSVSPGAHTWDVAGTDLLGATVTGPSQAFTIRSSRASAPPAGVVVISPRSGAVVWNPAPRLTWRRWTGSHGVVRYQVRIDGRVLATTTATSYTSHTALRDGRHTWSVVAIDELGARSASATFAFDVRSVRATSVRRRRLLAHGLTLDIFCAGRCSVSARVRLGRRGPSFSKAETLRGRGGVKTLTLRLSQPARQVLQSSPSALLYVKVRNRGARGPRTVTLVVRWSRLGLIGG